LVRVFNVYYPVRVIVLFAGEAAVVCTAFILAVIIRAGSQSTLVLGNENGIYKILGFTLLALILLYYTDLYGSQWMPDRAEFYSRLLLGLGLLAVLLGGATYVFPGLAIENGALLLGFILVAMGLFGWREAYLWMIRQSIFRERVWVVGIGNRAARIKAILLSRPELGLDVVDSTWPHEPVPGDSTGPAQNLAAQARRSSVHQVIVALSDRRGSMPMADLLELRLSGIKIEDGTIFLEKISGKMEVDEIHPSSLIFSGGFRRDFFYALLRRILAFSLALTGFVLLFPVIPIIALLIKVNSRGPIFYKQKRVGLNGRVFSCYKFRTMRHNAEAGTGAVWANSQDARVTWVGRWLRLARIDEIPQLWNVLRGDMTFVGPRPERPEFVEWLRREIPYYDIRHIVRPGVTGWAQVQYRYGSSLEDAKEKLKYDLYYLKHMSLSLDFVILFHTMKIVLLGRGSR
jgi:sugar transferase (PEP-CTERM system associated)